jgi:hypothetical protein
MCHFAAALVLAVVIVGGIVQPTPAEAGWKTNAALAVAVKAVPHAIESASPLLKKKALDTIASTVRKHPDLLPKITQTVVDYVKANPQHKSQGLKLLEQIRPRSALPPSRLASEWRSLPGKASGMPRKHIGAADKWLRGSHGNAGGVPGQVADRLRGKTFNNFDDFRSAFWKATGDDPVLSKGWSKDNVARMRAGKAPFARPTQAAGASRTYQLHHKTPINQGGGVYDLDNIQVVTPRLHREILEKGYHYGK